MASRRFPVLLLLAIAAGAAAGIVRPALAQPDAYGPHPAESSLTCYEHARDQTALSNTQAHQLCQGAATEAPLGCYQRAGRQTDLSSDDAIALCQCAISDAPVSCYERGRRETELETPALLNLCSPLLQPGIAAGCQPAPGGPPESPP
jgi:hypothetical protein